MEYLYLLIGIVALFWRSMLCGYVVDDGMRYNFWKERKTYTLEQFPIHSRIWQGLYGAGMFRNKVQEHLFTTLLHYVTCVLIYKATGSLLISFLYMYNPVNNQVAVWLNGRRYQIGIICALIAWNWNFLFVPAYVFAVWLHVGAVCLPVLMLFTQVWWTVPFGVAGFGIFGFRKMQSIYRSRQEDFYPGNELQKIKPQKIMIVIKTLGFYFFHSILPNKPRMYHEHMYYFSRYETEIKRGYSFNFEFFKGLAVVAFVGYEIFVQHNVWAVWWLAFIIQWCGLAPVTQNAADRYCSLANVGLMVVLVKYVNMLPSLYIPMVYTALFTFYILRYLPLFWAYKTVDNFHYYHIQIQPDGVEARALQAVRYMRINDAMTSFAILKKGLHYRPNDFKLLITMSQTLFALNNPSRAMQVLAIAGKHVPLGDEEEFRIESEKIAKHPNLGGQRGNRKQRRKDKKGKG